MWSWKRTLGRFLLAFGLAGAFYTITQLKSVEDIGVETFVRLAFAGLLVWVGYRWGRRTPTGSQNQNPPRRMGR